MYDLKTIRQHETIIFGKYKNIIKKRIKINSKAKKKCSNINGLIKHHMILKSKEKERKT